MRAYYIFLFLIAGALPSCKKFIAVAPPPDQIFSEEVFRDETSATAAIVGLYSEMTRTNLNFANGALTLYPALSADELYRTSPSATIDVFTVNEIPSSSTLIRNNFWTAPYNYIYHANAILEGLQNAPISDSIKRLLRGEAKIVRAFCYFYLVNVFGDVPLIVSTDYRQNATQPRTAAAAVYQQIEQDLVDAKSLLPLTYPSAGRLRPNRLTAAALLARMYLYRQQWAKAEAEATEIISAGLYSLAPVTAALATSNEVIWQLSRETQNTAEGATFIPSTATVRPSYALTDTLVKSFEAGDQRKVNWLKSNTVTGVTYWYPYKYKVASSTTVTERLMVLRLGEIWLIRAEARMEQNNLLGALADLNAVRGRAGLASFSGSTQSAVREAIYKERKVELFMEWGHRWFDLKRWNRASATIGSMKPASWQATDVLYPLPLPEIEANPFLTQNPGY